MKILICASEAPIDPMNGLRLQIRMLLRELRRRHEVRVLAYRLPDQDAPHRDEEPRDEEMRLVSRPSTASIVEAARLVRATLRRRPLRADALAAGLLAPLREEITTFEPDVVHVTSGRLAALGRHLGGRAAILAALDASHLNVEARAALAGGVRRRLLHGEASRIRRFITHEYSRFASVVVVSDADAAALRALDRGLNATVIPNGVDAGAFAPPPGVERRRDQILFTGVMSYPPNEAAAAFLARRVYPLVRAERPEARLVIAGREPSASVRHLAGDGVTVTGEVPDLRPWLSAARVYACPMLTGTGMKNKILEAMANGLPCVATPLALQGIAIEHGVHVLIGEDETTLARHLIRVLDDDTLAGALGEAARGFVAAAHDWAAVGRAYEEVYRKAAGTYPAPASRAGRRPEDAP